MAELIVNSRRLFKVSDPISIATQLNRIARQFMDGGWQVKRGFAGIVILKLQDGEIHYIPTGKGIEEIIFERSKDNE
ncbi:MAG: hypothetical protein GX352_07020 [Clostridiales bacterium]|nr:hypothetical protein [Clostridiales bacterium]